MFRDNQTFRIVFASAMKRDYDVYPSMIDAQPAIVWFYDSIERTSVFNETNPLVVQASRCDSLSICVWYLSPLWQFSDAKETKYALLGEWKKWTAVSRQRFVSIRRNAENTATTVTIEGMKSEVVSIVVYHSNSEASIVSCRISATNAQANLLITPTNATCS